MIIESKHESCLYERARFVIVNILGVALNEVNEETGELHLPNNFGHVDVLSMYLLAML